MFTFMWGNLCWSQKAVTFKYKQQWAILGDLEGIWLVQIILWEIQRLQKIKLQSFNTYYLVPPPKSDLKFVNIYFETSTFDRITKDQAAKPVDILSAIGGTMGLLTGFSIISAVEILYFAVKILFNLIKRTNKKI